MEEELRFGPFSIVPARRKLLREGEVVPLGSRAMDILLFLIAHRGEPKTNTEIVNHVWPTTFVGEANLRVHMSALRKALEDRQRDSQIIANTPGRGYTFIAAVESGGQDRNEPASANRQTWADQPTSRIFGRKAAVATIAGQLARGRLVTIAGPGGIGKSAVARLAASNYAGEADVVWIDFSEIGRGELVQTVVASALGVISRTDNILPEIISFLKTRRLLLVLDSCEHLVANVAEFVEKLLAQTSEIRILATSREPLRAEGERVHRLLPLELPQGRMKAEDALASPAVQLFVERADACLGGYELTDEDAPHVVDICTRLDGIALAIELAAGRLETIGVATLSRSLSDGFRLLTRGRRTALARHQTLRATLDWSYQILPSAEQQALNALSVLPGWFASDMAAAILSVDETDDILAALVAKSLIAAATPSGETLYRLLDTTRLYAAEKLKEAGERHAAMTRLAEYLTALFESAEHELYSVSMEEWSREFGQYVASLRAALEWAFGESGNGLLGVRLTVAALPLFFRLSLLDECLACVTQAIRFLESQPGLDERRRMKLYAALGWPQLRSTDAPEFGVAAWSTAYRIAEELGDVDYQLRALWALWVDAINRAQPRLGLTFAEQFGAQAPFSSDPTDVIIGRRMKGATLHWLGQAQEAREQLERMIAEYQRVAPQRHSVRFQFDQKVTASIIHARCLWLLDHEDEALEEIEETIRYAAEIRHDLSLTTVLAEAACPLALLAGRDELAADYIQRLRDHTKALSLDVWHTYADCFEAELHLRAGRYQECLRQLQRGMPVLRGAGFILFQTIFQSVEAQALSRLGHHEEALATLDAALNHCESSGERWCLPELYRVKGLVLLAANGPAAAQTAGHCYRTALGIAGEDGTKRWEHRIRTSISDLPASISPASDRDAALNPDIASHTSGIAP